MICDRVREQIPLCLAGRLDAASRDKLIDHLDACSSCRAEMADLGVVWRGMEAMQEPEPSAGMRSRFLETLHAYQEGYQEGQRKLVYDVPRARFWAGWWPAKPAWQAAFAAALLLAGLAGGRFLMAPDTAPRASELAQLKGQVENLRQLVALSLLQEQSASARLRGVTYSYQISQPDQQVRQALLHAVNHDSNVNVRLSAVDALAKFASDPDVRRALADSLPVQDSPLVQVSLIDLLAQFNDPQAAAAIRNLSLDNAADPEVRRRAASTLEKMGAAR